MKKKPLFIALIVAGAIIGIVLIILFIKDSDALKSAKTGKKIKTDKIEADDAEIIEETETEKTENDDTEK